MLRWATEAQRRKASKMQVERKVYLFLYKSPQSVCCHCRPKSHRNWSPRSERDRIPEGETFMLQLKMQNQTNTAASSSFTFAVLVGVAAGILLILLLLVIYIIIRSRKKKVLMPAKEKHPLPPTGFDRHVGHHEEIPMKEHLYGNIDLIDPKWRDSKVGYSQDPGRQQEEQVFEELNYSTIQHFKRPETSPTDSTGEEIVEYATVRH